MSFHPHGTGPLAQSPSAKNVRRRREGGFGRQSRRRPKTQMVPTSFYTDAKQRGDPWSLRRPTDGARKRSKGGTLGPSGDRRMVRGSEAKGGPLVPPATDGWCEDAKQRGDPWSLRRPTDGARKRSKGGTLGPSGDRRMVRGCEAKGTGGVRWNARALGAPRGPASLPSDSPSAYGTFLEVLRVHPRSGLQPSRSYSRRRQTEGCRTSERPNMSARRSTGRFRTSAERLALCIRDVPRSSPCASTIGFAAGRYAGGRDRPVRRPSKICCTSGRWTAKCLSIRTAPCPLAQSPSAKNVTATDVVAKVGSAAKVVGDR